MLHRKCKLSCGANVKIYNNGRSGIYLVVDSPDRGLAIAKILDDKKDTYSTNTHYEFGLWNSESSRQLLEDILVLMRAMPDSTHEDEESGQINL